MIASVGAIQLQAMLQDGEELALLDVREAGQFGHSHLLFAVPLPYSRLELDIGRLVPRRAVRVVLCDDGASDIASLAAHQLAAIGYENVSVLDGGTRAWAAAGCKLFSGVNVPSKVFGELVELAYRTPHIDSNALVRMQKAGEDMVIVDGRPFAEYRKMSIPGGICCPNAELPYRIREIVKRPTTRIVVNCAGRTRSILGAQTLINFGIPNPVCALENGTQGWVLSDLELERGADRRYPDFVDAAHLPELRAAASKLAQRCRVRSVSADEVDGWLRGGERTVYVCDVRTPEEFAAGSLRGALHAPGGQLIQATDQWIGVRNARIVLIDNDGVRAPVVASWLVQMGYDAQVLAEGIDAPLSVPPAADPRLPELKLMTVAELAAQLPAHNCLIIDLRASTKFRAAHIPGSHWSIRPRIAAQARAASQPVVLVADDANTARAASLDLAQAGVSHVQLLDGGFDAWLRAGFASEASPDSPPDADCIDYLFFVHDRHAGNRAAMRQYLEWETGLVAQLDARERALFRLPPTA